VWELQAEGKSTTKELFDKVGKEVGVSGTVASEVYYDIMKMIGGGAESRRARWTDLARQL
jgi:hypothetical protein